ncbi:MAG: stage III sporulation protein AD [Clostridia bacterium]|nr:stage III sporulation protein AD [Clostridia bacterium]
MEVLRILGIGIVTAVLSLLIKQHRPELAIAIPVLGGAAIFFCTAPYLRGVVKMFENLAEQAGLQNQYLRLILKMIGVAYLCQFSAELCRDAGEISVAGKIELGGKLLILSLSMPIVYQLLGLVEAIINF